MLDAQWAEADHPDVLQLLLLKANHQWTVRKLRLFACACVARHCHLQLTQHPDAMKIVEAAEEFADGAKSVRPKLGHLRFAISAFVPDDLHELFNSLLADCRDFISLERELGPTVRTVRELLGETEGEQQAHLLRDILGNPFRPVSFSRRWRTSTVMLLAQQMYESRDFSAMPILADALQDAGCDNDDILNHCRAESLHVRGCWVVDLVLARQ